MKKKKKDLRLFLCFCVVGVSLALKSGSTVPRCLKLPKQFLKPFPQDAK